MGKIITLNRNNGFRRVYMRGTQYASPILVTYILRNRSRNLKLGITTSKKIGNAVQRNRARRVIKEAYRLIYHRIVPGYDIVFVARSRTHKVKMNKIMNDMCIHLKKAGVLQ